ncbi:hypothetical protein [Halococcoides cellulosivorans]|nr:hypothetical protein [Halococcoides cellulosivorans]
MKRALALLVIVLLAGCTAPIRPAPDTATPTATATSAPTPTSTTVTVERV